MCVNTVTAEEHGGERIATTRKLWLEGEREADDKAENRVVGEEGL